MQRFTFPPDILRALDHERFHHPHPLVQRKMHVLWLTSRGLTQEQIAHALGFGRRTVQRYQDDYRAGGLAALRQLRYHQPPGELTHHRDTLEDHFRGQPPRSVVEAQAAIERLTGVRRGLTQVRAFLKKLSACAGARSAPSRPRRMPTPRRPSSATS